MPLLKVKGTYTLVVKTDNNEVKKEIKEYIIINCDNCY